MPPTLLRPPRLRLLVLTMLGALPACGRGAPPAQAAAADTVPFAEADPRARPLFGLVRERGGVRAALDSLDALLARDPGMRGGTHQIAHALGRRAVAERGDLSVLDECTPQFQSGCIHGALEGYFQNGAQAGSASVREICRPSAAPGRPGYEALECWHGLGHGLMVQFAGDFHRALPLCDALETPAARRECLDGVFMERVVRAMEAGPDGGHGGHDGHAGRESAAAASRREVARMCSGLEAAYEPSCWLYQPALLVMVHGPEPRKVLRACDAAPPDAVDDCYRGFGKQYLGIRSGDSRAMIRACRRGDPTRAADCLLGGAEYWTDLSWTIEPGIAFCLLVPRDAKARCYGLMGQRLALVHPDAERAAAACREVESAFVGACLAGVRRTGS